MIISNVFFKTDRAALPTGNLISYYRFNNNVTDSEASNNLTANNISYGTGKSGQSIDFGAGTDSAATITKAAGASNFIFGNGSADSPYSISFYVKFDATGNQWLVNKRDDDVNENEWQVVYSSGTLIIQNLHATDNTIYLGISHTWTPSMGVWYHIVTTYDGSSADSGFKIWIDGGLKTSVSSSNGSYVAMSDSGSGMTVGKAGWSTGLSFSGEMDGLGIWDKELDKYEIAAIFKTQNDGGEIV